MKPELPQIIKKVGFNFHWDERKVWALDVPTENMPLSELAWHFDIPFWREPGGFYDLRPADVMTHPDRFPDEYRRTMNADTSHPIDVMYWRGRFVILDGLHRLVKQALENKTVIAVRKIPEAAIPKIVKS